MQRTLITGANGFVGQLLCKKLRRSGQHVIALTATTATAQLDADQHFQCDLRNADALYQTIKAARPSHVIHLAAITHIPTSFADPQLTWQTNVMASLNLMESLRRFAPDAFTLFVSSSEVYGTSFKNGFALDEQTACQPINPYAASKLAGEIAVSEYFRQGMRGVIARPFNHIGENQSPDFVTASFARQIARAEAGLQPPVLHVGNLDAQRDFLDVHDVCEAYLKLLQLSDDSIAHPRRFNIASGKPHSIRHILETLLSLSTLRITVEQDPNLLRPSDIPVAIGDNNAIRLATGWQPTIPLQETLQRLMTFWRAQAAH